MKTLHYTEYDLVASKVLLAGDTEQVWLRAMVLAVYEDQDVTLMTLDSLLIYFLDTGFTEIVTIDKVVPLPSPFAGIAPMVWSSRLYSTRISGT